MSETAVRVANFADPDQTPRSVAFDLHLHCLFKSVCSSNLGQNIALKSVVNIPLLYILHFECFLQSVRPHINRRHSAGGNSNLQSRRNTAIEIYHRTCVQSNQSLD